MSILQRYVTWRPHFPTIRAVEAIVNTTLVPYAVPWQTYGVPWYFPTPGKVLVRGAGDCQARAVVLASILHAKGIPATFVGSFDHLWVTYPGKQATELEQTSVAVAVQQPGGTYRFTWPQIVDWRASWAIESAYFWDSMPGQRLYLLLAGWFMIPGRRACARLAARVRQLRRGTALVDESMLRTEPLDSRRTVAEATSADL